MRFTKIFLLFLLITAYLSISACFSHSDGKLHVYFLNVGQGDAIYIRGPKEQDILIDGGPDNSVLPELGQRMPFYDHEIDLVILTHPDSDHLTGLIDITKRYKIKKIAFTGATEESPEYLAWQKEIALKGIPLVLIKKGSSINMEGGAKMDVLWPPRYLINQKLENTNQGSLVMRLSYKNIDFLLTGDAEEETGNLLLKDSALLEAEIFKVSHHGSENGLGNKKEVLEKIKPQLAVISVGKNRYGHPHKKILNLFKENKINWLRTDEKGTIEVMTDGENYEVR